MKEYPLVVPQSGEADGKIHITQLSPRGFTHQHEYFELVYVLGGTATRKMTDGNIHVTAGDYYVANPLSAHGYDDIQDLDVVVCYFLPESIDRALLKCPSISSLLSNKTLRFGVSVDINLANRVLHDVDGSVRRLVKNMEKEYEDKRTGYVEMLRCYLTQVLVCAARACEERIPRKAIMTVMGHLKQNYSAPLSLETLSQLVGYTPQYLSNLFTAEVGISIQGFLQRLRIEEACRLLKENKLSVAEVAAKVGYQDVRYFSKVFRRYQTVSAKEYRKTVDTDK